MVRTYLSTGENLWRDDLIRTEGLLRVHEGGQDFGRLLAFTWIPKGVSRDVPRAIAGKRARQNGRYVLLKDDGKGLLIPRGILKAVVDGK